MLLYADRDVPIGRNRSLAPLFCLGQNRPDGIAAFHTPCMIDRAWTNRATTSAMLGARATTGGDLMLDTVTVWAGLLVLRKGQSALRLLEEWAAWANGTAFDGRDGDTKRRPQCGVGGGGEDARFCRHTNDQSVLSLLLKQRGVKTFPVPISEHDTSDVWAWEAGLCDAPWPLQRSSSLERGADYRDAYGPVDTVEHLCQRMQGGWGPPMLDYVGSRDYAEHAAGRGGLDRPGLRYRGAAREGAP